MHVATQRLVGILLAVILIGAAAYVLFNLAIPAWGQAQAIRQEVDAKIGVMQQLSGLVANAKQLLGQFANLDKQMQPVSSALPATPQLPGVLATLSVLASQNSLNLTEVDFAETLRGSQSQAAPAQQKATSVQVTASLTGRYTDFKNWLKALESELRLMDVQEVSIQPVSTKPGESTFTFSVILSVYYQPEPQLITIPTTTNQ